RTQRARFRQRTGLALSPPPPVRRSRPTGLADTDRYSPITAAARLKEFRPTAWGSSRPHRVHLLRTAAATVQATFARSKKARWASGTSSTTVRKVVSVSVFSTRTLRSSAGLGTTTSPESQDSHPELWIT